MLDLLRVSALLAAFLALGRTFGSVLQITLDKPLHERVALWLILGLGYGTLLVFGLSLVAQRVALSRIGLLSVAALAIQLSTGMWRTLQAGSSTSVRRWGSALSSAGIRWMAARSPIELGLAFVLLFQVLTVGRAGMLSDLGWDGTAIWGLKARVVFIEGGVPPSLFTDLSRQWSHLNYPLMLPLSEALIYWALGRVDESYAKILQLAFYLVLLVLVYSAVRRRHSREGSLLITCLVSTTPTIVVAAGIGNADLLLSALALGTASYMYSWLETQRDSDLTLSVTLASLCAWSKQEGTIVLLFNLAIVALWALSHHGAGWRHMRQSLSSSLGMISALPWLIFAGLHKLPGTDFFPVTLTGALKNLDRIPVLIKQLIAELANYSHWGMLWFLFVLAAVYPLRRPRACEAHLFLSVALYLGLLTGAFVFSAWQPYVNHALTSLDRLTLQVAPVAWLFVATRLSGLLSEIETGRIVREQQLP